jgi:hypothetical protein
MEPYKSAAAGFESLQARPLGRVERNRGQLEAVLRLQGAECGGSDHSVLIDSVTFGACLADVALLVSDVQGMLVEAGTESRDKVRASKRTKAHEEAVALVCSPDFSEFSLPDLVRLFSLLGSPSSRKVEGLQPFRQTDEWATHGQNREDPTGCECPQTGVQQIPEKLKSLLDFLNECRRHDSLSVPVLAGLAMGGILGLWPFKRSNLVIATLVANSAMVRGGYPFYRYASLEKAVYEKRREVGLCGQALRSSLDENNIRAWLRCFLEMIEIQGEQAMTAAMGTGLVTTAEMQEPPLRETRSVPGLGTGTDVSTPLGRRPDELGELDRDILRLAALGKATSVRALSVATRRSRNTIKKCVQRLGNDGYLVRRGNGRSTYYSASSSGEAVIERGANSVSANVL